MNVFIVEDDAIMRDRLEQMMLNIPTIEVIGYAETIQRAIKRIHALLPDVVVLDLSLKDGSGIEVLEDIKEHHPAIKVIVLTNYADDYYLIRCMRAGADYFFDKYFQFVGVSEVLLQLLENESIEKPPKESTDKHHYNGETP